MRNRPQPGDRIIDSRDVIEAIAELESEIEDLEVQLTCDTCGRDGNTEDGIEAGGECQEPCEGTVRFVNEDDIAALSEELSWLRLFAESAEHVDDWQYGETCILDSHFEDYARQLAVDCAGSTEEAELISGGGGPHWPLTFMSIDWEAAAEALKADYSDHEFRGYTYWVRDC